MFESGIIDVDSHIIEPPDLWLSRLRADQREEAPRIIWDEVRQSERWFIGKSVLDTAAGHCHAGWKEPYPSVPSSLEEAHPAGVDAAARLAWMDQNGISAQLIYPNLLGFFGFAFMQIKDPLLRLNCVRAYNDFQSEWCDADPARLIPVAALPWWDVEGCVQELGRCSKLGHRAMNWASSFEQLGLPPMGSAHWDPVMKKAQALKMPVSFHVGFGAHSGVMHVGPRTADEDVALAKGSVEFFLGNAKCITELVFSGMCERFPDLRFVSVESGFGYLPFLIDSMDWQYQNNRASRRWKRLLPSEYFRRQIFATVWFEHRLDHTMELYPDNVMFETDFPHPTCICPGDGSIALSVQETIRQNMQALNWNDRDKILRRNAATVYGLETPRA